MLSILWKTLETQGFFVKKKKDSSPMFFVRQKTQQNVRKIERLLSPTGIEPVFLPWKGNVLTTRRKGLFLSFTVHSNSDFKQAPPVLRVIVAWLCWTFCSTKCDAEQSAAKMQCLRQWPDAKINFCKAIAEGTAFLRCFWPCQKHSTKHTFAHPQLLQAMRLLDDCVCFFLFFLVFYFIKNTKIKNTAKR